MRDYPDKVNDAFASHYGNAKDYANGQRLNYRYDVAKALLTDKYHYLIDELENKAKVQHDAEMDEWNMVLTDISLAADVSQCVSRF